MAIDLTQENITNEGELDQLAKAMEDCIVLAVHPSGAVWQIEGGTISGANCRLVESPLANIAELLVRCRVGDRQPTKIKAVTEH